MLLDQKAVYMGLLYLPSQGVHRSSAIRVFWGGQVRGAFQGIGLIQADSGCMEDHLDVVSTEAKRRLGCMFCPIPRGPGYWDHLPSPE